MEQFENQITLRGDLLGLPEFSHENHGKKFYRFFLEVARLSGAVDVLPVVAELRLLEGLDLLCGERMTQKCAGGRFAVCSCHGKASLSLGNLSKSPGTFDNPVSVLHNKYKFTHILRYCRSIYDQSMFYIFRNKTYIVLIVYFYTLVLKGVCQF